MSVIYIGLANKSSRFFFQKIALTCFMFNVDTLGVNFTYAYII